MLFSRNEKGNPKTDLNKGNLKTPVSGEGNSKDSARHHTLCITILLTNPVRRPMEVGEEGSLRTDLVNTT